MKRITVFVAIVFGSAIPCLAQPEAVSTSVTVHLNGAVDRVFELFDPLNRSLWDQDWEIEIVSPAGETKTRDGVVFRRLSDLETAWTVAVFDRDHHIAEFAYERSNLYEIALRVHCEEKTPNTTVANITYTALPKTDDIRRALDHQLEKQIMEMAKGEEGWETKINYYLSHDARVEVFEPLAIEKQHRFEFNVAPDELFPLLNPAGGNHWTPSTPKYVFGSADEPSGAMWTVGDGWMVLAEYNPDALCMKSVLYIPDTEFMIEKARCEVSPNGGTVLTVSWRVAGISKDGNDAVQAFFDQHWDMRMNMIKKSYEGLLSAAPN